MESDPGLWPQVEALGPRGTEQLAQQEAGWQQGQGGFAGPSGALFCLQA